MAVDAPATVLQSIMPSGSNPPKKLRHSVTETIALLTKFLLTSCQVQHMRRNLDQSEAAIIQVFEEKQRVWERQMDELRQNYASRLQQVTVSVINSCVIETRDIMT